MGEEMTIPEIRDEINRLATQMAAIGRRGPVVSFTVYASGVCVVVEWTAFDRSRLEHLRPREWFFADTAADAISDASAFVSGLPTITGTMRREFVDGLGRLLRFGEQAGVEAESLNALRQIMNRVPLDASQECDR